MINTKKRGKIALPLPFSDFVTALCLTVTQFLLLLVGFAASKGLDSHDLLGLCLDGLVHFLDHLVGDLLDLLFALL